MSFSHGSYPFAPQVLLNTTTIINALTAERDLANQGLNISEQNNQQLSFQYHALCQANQGLNQQVQLLTQLNQNKSTSENAARNAHALALKEIADLKRQLAGSRSQNNEKSEQLVTSSQKVAQLEEENQILQGHLEQVKKDAEERTAREAALDQVVSKVRADHSALDKKLSEAQKLVKQLKIAAAESLAKETVLKETQAKKEEEYGILEAKLAEATTKIQELLSKSKKSEKLVHKLQSDLNLMTEKSSAEYVALGVKLQKKEETYKSTLNQLVQLNKKLKALELENKDLLKSNDHGDTLYKELGAHYEQTMGVFAKLEQDHEKLQDEHEKLQFAYEQLQTKTASLSPVAVSSTASTNTSSAISSPSELRSESSSPVIGVVALGMFNTTAGLVKPTAIKHVNTIVATL